MWHPSVLAACILTQQSKFTKSTERSQHDQTNLIQRDWAGYSVAGQQSAAKTSRNGIKKKQLTGEIDWELEAIRSAQNSWKDELWTIVFVLILAANFVPALQDTMKRGFANLETTPLWVQWGMYASIAASFGIRTMRGLKK